MKIVMKKQEQIAILNREFQVRSSGKTNGRLWLCRNWNYSSLVGTNYGY